MEKLRTALLVIVVLAGAALTAVLVTVKPKTPLDMSFAPAFQLFGRTTATFSHVLSRLVPVNEMDEKAYGDAIAARYGFYSAGDDADHRYVNALMGSIAGRSRKNFSYRVFVAPSPVPNACAFPGGVLLVTRGLLETMKDEAQVTAVLAHEMGHVERGHCFNAVRFEMLARKAGRETLGKIADLAVTLMLRHSFSKTEEDEADLYAYELLLHSRYEPSALGGAFQSLDGFYKKRGHDARSGPAGPLREYFMTHPHIGYRIEKYAEEAAHWRTRHPGEMRYTGARNLRERVPLSHRAFPDEWRTGGKP